MHDYTSFEGITMFDWLRKLLKRKPIETEIIMKNEDLMASIRKTREEGSPSSPHVPLIKPSREEILKLQTDIIRKQFLPKPQTRRLTYTHSYTPPAERHREAINKFMKGGSARYRKLIKQSPKIKIEEEED